jgi:hypothetical protein
MNPTATFRHQHARILAMLAQVEPMLDARTVLADTASIHLQSLHLMRWVLVHLADEEQSLYPTLDTLRGPSARTVARFRDETAALGPMIESYEQRFAHRETLLASPETFVDETRQLVGWLRIRFEEEERELYPLADLTAVDAPARH